MPATAAWLGSAEALLNRGIAASTQATALARRLQGRSLQVDVDGIARIRAQVFGGRLALLAPDDSSPADATVTGSPLALLRMVRAAMSADRAPPSAQPTPAQIRGDAEVADLYRQLFMLARPDPEEELSRLIGDMPARRLSTLAGHALTWARRARRTAGENLAEYLQEESRDLVNKPELDEFLSGVDDLRETTDRIEARLSRLEQRLKSPP